LAGGPLFWSKRALATSHSAGAWMEKNQPKNEDLCRFRAEVTELLGSKKTPAPKTQQKEDKPAKK